VAHDFVPSVGVGQGFFQVRCICTVEGFNQVFHVHDGHFDQFLELFRQALQEVGVPDDKIDEVSKLLESERTFVLNPGE